MYSSISVRSLTAEIGIDGVIESQNSNDTDDFLFLFLRHVLIVKLLSFSLQTFTIVSFLPIAINLSLLHLSFLFCFFINL
jgi:hypothetical protein